MMTKRFLERLPIFACAGFIAFLFLANLWNFAVERDWPKLRIRSADQLSGVGKPQAPTWTLEAFMAGETQRAVSTNLGRNSLFFRTSVRAKNQFLFSLFHASGAAGVFVGRNEQLYAAGYIDEFCARGAAPSAARVKTWADDIADIAAAAKAKGKGFLYLAAPSKASHLPQFLPTERSCPAALTARSLEALAPFRAALQERGAPFLDAGKLLRDEQKNYPIDLFPRGGVHWNFLGAALALREMTGILERQPSGSPIGNFEFDWREDDDAKGSDRDLLDLLNLFWPDNHYPTAVVTGRKNGAACARTPRLLLVGDSFLQQLIPLAGQAPCPPEIDYWFYMLNHDSGSIQLARHFIKPGDAGFGPRLATNLAQLPSSVLAADAIVLEENESTIGETLQIHNLLSAIRAAQ